ncbi:hypothetical protein GOV07_02995 [Candidatus Woesearchaeota archaeon]|nr:hypothetical protein [Candidatus Woesearchaeota archaeon]
MNKGQLRQSPTLRTIRMVEEALKDMPSSLMTVPELKRALPRKVHHNALIDILEYLQEGNKIYWSPKGISWIMNDSPVLDRMLKEGRRL